MRLAADLGGTHARFALQSDPLQSVVYAARDFPTLDDVIAAALAAFGLDDAATIDAVIAVAGPVHAGAAIFTNLDWRADVDTLRERFGFASVRLLNDVECAARSAAAALPADIATVQPAPHQADARHVLVSVGTGLGVAYWRGSDEVDASEAGHAGFAPTIAWDHTLLSQLQTGNARTTWEHVLSGPGLARIDSFVSGSPCVDGAQVAQRASRRDPHAIESIRHFSRLLGVFCGDLVLAAPVTGGVLLAGGVIAGLGAHFDAAAFVAGFRDKGAMAALPAALPVWRTADTGLALRGALL